MSDLKLNSQALTGFANTLHKLLGDFAQPVYLSPGRGDVLDDDLSLLSSTDKACGDGLNSYLTALAALADQAAAAALSLDQGLADDVRQQRGRAFE
ncbi:hypothetical protein GCM10009839_49080 [Catenulispora yoronensis]|uniref:ESX-1 secretion-associated protein n=1 Tax=Catenulispora yoronensis TaxID=450799 RepID=A0ABN2UV58_9ACTN